MNIVLPRQGVDTCEPSEALGSISLMIVQKQPTKESNKTKVEEDYST